MYLKKMAKKKSKSIIEKCKKIKLVITDVDGVLTDGGRYYGNKGETIKKFHTHDGMGINLLLRNKIPTIILTKEKSLIVKKWAKDMNISSLYWGAIQKELELPKIIQKFSIKNSEIAFIGDDVNDLNVIKKIGLSACPSDANSNIISYVDYICTKKGGHGCLREIADMILSVKFPHKKK